MSKLPVAIVATSTARLLSGYGRTEKLYAGVERQRISTRTRWFGWPAMQLRPAAQPASHPKPEHSVGGLGLVAETMPLNRFYRHRIRGRPAAKMRRFAPHSAARC
jgi:hypothetical protein